MFINTQRFFFLKQLETELLAYVYSGGDFVKTDCLDDQILDFSVHNYSVFFVILGPENICLDVFVIVFLRIFGSDM